MFDTRPLDLFSVLIILTVALLPFPVRAQQADAFLLRHWTAESAVVSAPSADSSYPVAQTQPSCVNATVRLLGSDAAGYGRGLEKLPRSMVSRESLKWELPIAVATAVLITSVDSHVSNQVKNAPYTTASDSASNILLASGLGLVSLDYLYGCVAGKPHERTAAFAALEAGGYGIASDLLLKAAFNREYPDKYNGDGRFWHGGKSFPSGHAATSWAVASAIAHSYPHNRWMKWGAYGAATSISVLRLTARKHFPSDVVIGGTLGYVTGSYLASR